MDHRLKCKKNLKTFRKTMRDSSGSRARQKILRFDIKGKIHKRKSMKIDYVNLIRLNQNHTFCTVKNPIKRMKRQDTDRQKIFANHPSKGQVSRIYKELSKLNSKNTIIQLENEQTTRLFTERVYRK